jgi:lysozyme
MSAKPWLAIALVAVGAFEGVRQTAYLDPVGIPTICFGETKNVRMGDKATLDHCSDLLESRLQEFGRGVDQCIKTPLPPYRKAAFTSFAYNVGVPAFCSSTLVKKYNAGDWVGACDQLKRWITAKGVTLPGLVKRREVERQFCMREMA